MSRKFISNLPRQVKSKENRSREPIDRAGFGLETGQKRDNDGL
jgi:hypothetical protein